MRSFFHQHRSGGQCNCHYLFMRPKDRSPKNAAREPCTRGCLPNKMSHFFVFFVPGDLDLWHSNSGEIFVNARNHKVSSSYVQSFEVIVFTNKETNWQTNRHRWKHPLCSAMLCRWV